MFIANGIDGKPLRKKEEFTKAKFDRSRGGIVFDKPNRHGNDENMAEEIAKKVAMATKNKVIDEAALSPFIPVPMECNDQDFSNLL